MAVGTGCSAAAGASDCGTARACAAPKCLSCVCVRLCHFLRLLPPAWFTAPGQAFSVTPLPHTFDGFTILCMGGQKSKILRTRTAWGRTLVQATPLAAGIPPCHHHIWLAPPRGAMSRRVSAAACQDCKSAPLLGAAEASWCHTSRSRFWPAASTTLLPSTAAPDFAMKPGCARLEVATVLTNAKVDLQRTFTVLVHVDARPYECCAGP